MKFLRVFFVVSVILCGFCSAHKAQGQTADSVIKVIDNWTEHLLYRNNDTNYISNYSDQLALKLISHSKFNFLRIRDRDLNSRLRYRPVRDLNLGIGVAYKFFAVDLTLRLGLRDHSEIDSRVFDFQAQLFSSKQLFSVVLQYYKGYRLANVGGVQIDPKDASMQREDMRTILYGMQYMYATNYTKFSMKAPFVFNERQKKSAGSVLVGASFNLYNLDADSSLVPVELNDYFREPLRINDLNILNAGIKAGYMYTFIFKDYFFITASVIPGLVLNFGDYHTTQRYDLPTAINFSFTTRNAIGYNGEKFFSGFSFISDTFYAKIIQKGQIETGQGRISLFVGYRFGVGQ